LDLFLAGVNLFAALLLVLNKEYIFVIDDFDTKENTDFKLENRTLDILDNALNHKEKQVIYLLLKSIQIEHIAKFMDIDTDKVNIIKKQSILKLKDSHESNNFFGSEYWDKFEG